MSTFRPRQPAGGQAQGDTSRQFIIQIIFYPGIIMKIYLAHSSKYDFKNELYKPLQTSQLNKEHEIYYLYDVTDTPGSTKEIIKNSDLIVAEASYPSVGMGIELGWADAFGKQIISIYKSEKPATSFLTVLGPVVKYTGNEDVAEVIERETAKLNK